MEKSNRRECSDCVSWKKYGMSGWPGGACYYSKFPMWIKKGLDPKDLNPSTDASNCNCYKLKEKKNV